MSAKNLVFNRPGLAFLLIPFFFACDDPSQLGIELDNEDSKVEVKYLEITLPSSSIFIDSLATYNGRDRNTERKVLFGDYTDSIYGRTRAIAFAQYGIDGGQLPQDTLDLEFRRAFLALGINEFYADLYLTDESIRIYQAQDTLYTNTVYLAGTALPYDNTAPIADHTFEFNPGGDTILQVPLSDEFGNFLFQRLSRVQINDDYKDSLLLGYYYYPPLVLEPGPGCKGLYSFDLNDEDDTTAIYIEMASPLGKLYYFKFDFNGETHFSHIQRDRSGGKLSDLLADYGESAVPSPRTYINPVAGVFTKLNLQPFIDFIDSSTNIIINKAQLEITPATPVNVYEEIITPIGLFYINENGKLDANISATSTGYSPVPALSLSLNEDDYFSADFTAIAQVSFLDQHVSESEYPGTEMVIFPYRQVTAKRASLIKSEIKLKLFYTRLK